MLKRAVTVQANTVDEAILQALEILKLHREQVHVEILTNPGRRLHQNW
ncbi:MULTISPECIES: Jag N-terminal domain-containing protein [unclassified Sporosarcina]|nr:MULTISPECIES: Jag N-terminal domain-containing protein [unclassified Sporosarcina]